MFNTAKVMLKGKFN